MPQPTFVGGGSFLSGDPPAIPAHQAGDLIIVHAWNGNTTAIALPSGWTNIDATNGNTQRNRLAYKVAASSSEDLTGWASVYVNSIEVWRNASLGAFGFAATNSGSGVIGYPAVTLQDTSGNSEIALFAGCRHGLASVGTAPTGASNIDSASLGSGSTSGSGSCHRTGGGVTSWSSQNVATASDGNSVGYAVEIKYVAPGGTDALLANDVSSGTPTVGAPAIGQTHALLANDVAAGAPTVTSPAIGQVHVLDGADIASGTPTVSVPALGTDGTDALLAEDISSGVPTVGTPSLGQVHALLAESVSAGVPSVSSPVLASVAAVAAHGGGFWGGRQTKRYRDEQRRRLKEALQREAEAAELLDEAYDKANGIARVAFEAAGVPAPEAIPVKVREIVRDMPDQITNAMVNDLLKAIATYQRQQMEEEEAMVLLLVA